MMTFPPIFVNSAGHPGPSYVIIHLQDRARSDGPDPSAAVPPSFGHKGMLKEPADATPPECG